MNDNSEIYNRMIAEIDAINERADERHAEVKAMFEELNTLIDDVLGGV